jgi:hypothetical protein
MMTTVAAGLEPLDGVKRRELARIVRRLEIGSFSV